MLPLRIVRIAALIDVLVGSVGSVALMLYVGRRNDSKILLLLFTFWVLSPFAGLASADALSKGWSLATRGALYGLMFVLMLASLGIYGSVALNPPREKAAFVFVVVPAASWLLIAIVLPVAAFISRRTAS